MLRFALVLCALFGLSYAVRCGQGGPCRGEIQTLPAQDPNQSWRGNQQGGQKILGGLRYGQSQGQGGVKGFGGLRNIQAGQSKFGGGYRDIQGQGEQRNLGGTWDSQGQRGAGYLPSSVRVGAGYQAGSPRRGQP